MSDKAIVWIREDFRINNNPALAYASHQHNLVSALYIFNPKVFIKKEKLNNGGYQNLWKILKLNYQN